MPFSEDWYDEPDVQDTLIINGKCRTIPRVSSDDRVQEIYKKLRAQGVGHDAAQDTALKSKFRQYGIPAIGLCETSFLRDFKCNGDYLGRTTDPRKVELFKRRAKAAGVNITGKNYNPALARSVGDPMAWVGSMDDVQRVCKARGDDCKIKDGALQISMKGGPLVESKPKPLAN